MKFSGQSKHGSIDNLLRAYASRPSDSHQMCTDFDPDRANSYIERSLTGASRLQYEAHLSECGSCRKSVVALVRLAETDATASVVPRREATKSTWVTGALSGAKQLFGALSQPRWAMAAAAVVVLAISLPVLLSRNQAPDAPQAIVESEKPQSAVAAAGPSSNASPAEAVALAEPSKQPAILDEKKEISAGYIAAARKKPDAPAEVDAVTVVAKAPDAPTVFQSDDEQKRKAESQPAQAAGAPGSQVARNEADQNRQQPSEKDSAQQAGDTKALARADEPSAKKESERRAEEIAPPPPAASSSEVARSRSGLKPPARLALRDSAGEAVRTEERKLSGKKFFFRDGAWTDKDFNPNKDLPVVTIVRDSNVYKELIAKRSGLRSIMERFGSSERAVIVYKGTVYKLIPQ